MRQKPQGWPKWVTGNFKTNTMEWYKSLNRKQKAGIREAFELSCGLSLNSALMLFSFSECIDILYNKLKIEGFQRLVPRSGSIKLHRGKPKHKMRITPVFFDNK